MNTIKTTLLLDDKLSPAYKSAASNVAANSAKIEKSTKSATEGFAQLAKQVLSIEIMRKAAMGLAGTLKYAEGYSELAKTAKTASDNLAKSIGTSLMPTITELTKGFSELSEECQIVGQIIGGAFAAVVAGVKSSAIVIYKAIETVVAFLEMPVMVAATIPKKLLPSGWADGIDEAAANIELLRKTFAIAGEDMAKDAGDSWQKAGDILTGKLRAKSTTPETKKEEAKKTSEPMDAQVAAFEENKKAVFDLEAMWAQNTLDMKKEKQDEWDKTYQKSIEDGKAQAKKDAEDYKANQELKLDASRTFFGGFSALLAVAGKKSKEAAVAAKALAITQAIIDTAVAAVKAYQSLAGITVVGPALGAVAAAGTIAFGAAQIATISAAKFALGGIVPGNQRVGDNVNARLNSGEMVLNLQQQATLFDIASGRARGGSNVSIGGDTIIIQGNASQSTVRAIQQTRQRQLIDLHDMLSELSYSGKLSFA